MLRLDQTIAVYWSVIAPICGFHVDDWNLLCCETHEINQSYKKITMVPIVLTKHIL